MSVFKLMRRLHETPDAVTRAISEHMTLVKKSVATNLLTWQPQVEAGRFFMEFWNMKQRGELPPDECPAVWAVLMRGVPVRPVLRIVLENCISIRKKDYYAGSNQWMPPRAPPPVERLWECIANYTGTLGVEPNGQHVKKMRTNLCSRLRTAASSRGLVMYTLDPVDADLLLQACETALVVAAQEYCQWATVHR